MNNEHQPESRWIYSGRRRRPFVFLALLLLCQCVTPTDSFATYLLSNIGCMTDLSTDEVIMNNQVVDAEDSDRPMVHLVLNNDDGQDKFIAKMETVQEISKIWLKPTEEELEFHIQMYVDNIKDLQFTMETTPGAAFVNGQCENNKRVAGRGEDFVALRIPSTTTSTVQVWAGWATGHEKVRLTYPLEFIPAAAEAEIAGDEQQADTIIDDNSQENAKPEAAKTNPEQDAEKWAEKIKMYQNAEEVKENIEEVQRRDKEVEQRELKQRSNDKSDHRKGEEKKEKIDDDEGNNSRKKVKGETNRKQRDDRGANPRRGGAAKNPQLTDSGKDLPDRGADRYRDHYIERVKEKHRKITEHLASRSKESASNSEDSESSGILLDTTWFLYGLTILLVGTFGAMRCCLYASRKGDGKGRREL